MKKALIIRLGAIGDTVIITPLIKLIKQDGYHVTVMTSKTGAGILRHNPNIDKILLPPEDDNLDKYLEEIKSQFEKVVNLTGSIEKDLALITGPEHVFKNKEFIRKECDVNYYDHTNKLGGYDVTGLNGELYFSPLEHSEAKRFCKKFAGKFVILWSLAGSSYHKTYPYSEYVAQALLKYSDIVILTVGDGLAQLLEWQLPNTKNYSDKWPIRKSMIMTKYVDLVIGPDTGILHAAGCFDTPKIILLSAVSEENVPKYWKNKIVLSAPVPCNPCYRIVYNREACPLELGLNSPVCMSKLPSKMVFEAIEQVYFKWRNKWKSHGQSFTPGKEHFMNAKEGYSILQEL